tara:strand:- start:95 stop:1363 length:1269 start_codon:yes stop_codon:yes gene_type:complete
MSLKKRTSNPIFLGLTHVGQVFSIGWSKKIGNCAVYDFDQKKLRDFENFEVTNEEPNLKKYLAKNVNKIRICKSKMEIKRYKNVFLTIDTPLKNNGDPEVKVIKNIIAKSVPYIGKNSNLIITSQVYCGFCDDLKKTILKRRKDINLIYMAETLIMGNALSRFTNPERLIFGTENKNKFFFKLLKKFKCEIFVLNLKEAEMVKIAVNLFLLTSVTYANALDYYCRQFGFKFSKINGAIKADKRIGKYSYLSPSLGVSGGHLERDLYTINKTTKSKHVKYLFSGIKKLNNSRIDLLFKEFKKLDKKFRFNKIIWMGPSYKENSFSIINSPFLKFKNKMIKNKKKLFTYDSFFNLSNYKKINPILNIQEALKGKSILIILNYVSDKDLKFLSRRIKSSKIKVLETKINSYFESEKNKNITKILN